MSPKFDKMETKRKIPVKDLNPMLTCSLCEGYLVDATVLTDCLHVFCRGCIIKYFDNCRTACPNCNIIYKKKTQICFRPDHQLQSLVYKIVPNLYAKEMQRRDDFYRSTGVRASSSCSDDSVIEKERLDLKDRELGRESNVPDDDKTEFFSSDDLISLSIEYYQTHLDSTKAENGENQSPRDPTKNGEIDVKTLGATDDGKRFLECPAAVTMQLLQKFLRMKFGLTANHRVDVIYRDEVLPAYFTLMDVAYTFKWSRTKPMRFFYRIFSPLKIKPIKIINTTSTTGSKQLQVVKANETNAKTDKIERTLIEKPRELMEETEDQSANKERLMAHLQLQSTHKKKEPPPPPPPRPSLAAEKDPVCVYEYVEPDKEEIKRFAEKRDREWALQKKLDEKNDDYHFSKKRKKSKHSKNDSLHKKRKLHAEITSNEEEDLKLKVKITPHKHKHHKSHEMSTKEKLLQMRQVRHKHSSLEDKTVQTTTSIVDKINENLKQQKEKDSEKKKEIDTKIVRFADTPKKEDVKATPTAPATEIKQIPPKEIKAHPSKEIKPLPAKETKPPPNVWLAKNPMIKIERMETEKQQSFLKSFQSYTEKYNLERFKQNNLEARQKASNIAPKPPVVPIEKKSNNATEPKKPITPPPKQPENAAKIINNYHPGFTVSKIEVGTKRKADPEPQIADKRPSLEITLIPQQPQPAQPTPSRNVADKPPTKRPLPSTIPLERIRKNISLKAAGISIIAKPSDLRDNIGALDLSNKSPETSPKPSPKPTNGIGMLFPNRHPISSDNKLSNLQMLSKVATEHPILNKLQQQTQNLTAKTVRKTAPPPPVPLSTAAGTSTATPKPHLPKLPNLTEISKTHFKNSALNAVQIRPHRPNQNQNIRNIPNPSLLVRQQNQNRLNLMGAPSADKETTAVVGPSGKVNNSLVEKKEIPV